MTFSPVLENLGLPVFVCTREELRRAGSLPDGYCSVAVVLPEAWRELDLIWLLNDLYGGQFADAPYRHGHGGRTFTFYGERCELAHDLCGALRDAWLLRDATDENIICTLWSDSLPDFIESFLLISVPTAEKYYGQFRYFLAVVPDDESREKIVSEILAFEEERRRDRS